MLRYAALFFAVGLASSFHHNLDPTPPKWGSSYKVDGEIHFPLAGVREPITIWVDGAKGAVRIDNYDGVNHYYYFPSSNFPGKLDEYQVYPITTEKELNKKMCLYASGVQPIGGLLPDLAKYKFVGEEKLFGKQASKWQRVVYTHNITFEYTMWLAHVTDLAGNERPVPLRYEHKMILSIKQSKVFVQDFVDYFNYETKEIDPEIFKIDVACNYSTEFHPTIEHHFNNFKIKHGKEYTSEEEHEQRLHIFRHNLRNIEAHNRAGSGFKLAVNHLADRTPEELAFMTGMLPSSQTDGGRAFPYDQDKINQMNSELPEEFDWRIHGAVTPVKDQLVCGSCWAFSAVGAVEGALYLHTRQPVERLSEQALVDCSWGEGNTGCRGGLPAHAFDWIKLHGLPRYMDYGGYMAENGLCHRNNVTDVVTIKDYVCVPSKEDALRLAVYKHGPVSVGIEATFNLLFYSEGVFSGESCKQNKLNHGVLVIGYGVLDGQRYWIVKNSWGSQWGNQGYVLMAADGNTCGILDMATYVTFD